MAAAETETETDAGDEAAEAERRSSGQHNRRATAVVRELDCCAVLMSWKR